MAYINNKDRDTQTELKMSKIEMARKIAEQNPNLDRKGLIATFISQLNMTQAGATTYAYNLSKGKAKTKTVSISSIVKKVNEQYVANKQSTEDRLAMMKDVSHKFKQQKVETEYDREVMQAEIDVQVNEAMEYVRDHAPAFLRKELGLQ